MGSKKEDIKVGIICGAGSGPRLVGIFKRFLKEMMECHSKAPHVVFIEDKEIYHTYQSLVDFIGTNHHNRIQRESTGEAQKLAQKYQSWFKKHRLHAVFRTAINAESLYQVRQYVSAIKEFRFKTPQDIEVLIIRDQAEGFYSNINYQVERKKGLVTLKFYGQYSEEHQKNIAKYALKKGIETWPEGNFDTWAIYKHHLFGDHFDQWIKDVNAEVKAQNSKLNIVDKIYQPDTGFTNLLNNYIYYRVANPLNRGENIENGKVEKNKGNFNKNGKKQLKRNLLVFCSNEIGDLIYEVILGALNLNVKFDLYTKNVFLGNPFHGDLVEYQTVHGSADDKSKLEDQDLKPYATLRIAAEMAEILLQIKNARQVTDEAIAESKVNQLKETDEIVDFVVNYVCQSL